MSLSGRAGYTLQVQYAPKLIDCPELCQPGFLFNEGVHLQQQSADPFYLITALNQSTGKAEARCAFFTRPDGAVSPGAAPFGSIEFAEWLPQPVLDNCISVLIETARSTGASTLRLVNYPDCYAPEQASRLTYQLLRYGFQILENHATFYLPVTTESLATYMKPAERRRLRKCQRANLQFEQWTNPNVTAVLSFLVDMRRQKQYPLTISPESLTRLLEQFANAFTVFVVRDNTTIAALTVAVRVRADILYNFLPASHPAYDQYSPMVLLTDGLFTYCQQQRIRLLDLGVSLDNNRRPKPSLMRFKRNLGALESPKVTFEKTL